MFSTSAIEKIKSKKIYALEGNIGAGKTTIMKMILDLTRQDSGEIKILGSDNLYSERKKIGSLIESPAIFKSETAFENMKRYAILSGDDDNEIRRILNMVGLADTGRKKAGEFSLGMKQRLGLAIALLGNPEIMILDEPLNGLDPTGIKEFRDIILNLNQKGVTFFISSHLLDELGKIATDYGIINKGVLTEEVSAEDLKKYSKHVVIIVTDNGLNTKNILENNFNNINIDVKENEVTLISDEIDNFVVNKLLIENGVKVYEIKNKHIDLEKYFIERLK